MKSVFEVSRALQQINIVRHHLSDDGTYPNNGLHPLLVYRKVLQLPDENRGKIIAEFFESNGWTNSWEDGILNYHHYHSTAHEVLGVINGSARIQFGGSAGVSLMLEEGDVVIIPAGVAHKNISEDDSDFRCVGAYPDGQKYDMNMGDPKERPGTDNNIKNLPLPETDPVYGMEGPLLKNWTGELGRNEEEIDTD